MAEDEDDDEGHDVKSELPKPRRLKMYFGIFRASEFTSWEKMCTDVASFANKIGPDRLASIAQSEYGGRTVITVWYWWE